MKNKYMLIFHNIDWHTGLSAEEMQQVAMRWTAWFNRLKDEGFVLGGNPLEPNGKVVSGAGGQIVTDGPFSEAKEAIGGYFLIEAGSLEQAANLARECPGLSYGAKVEVRPVMDQCPVAALAEAAAAGAAA
ncbi:MAG TPA: YciI family protein [Chthoniobacteraceae bacterium]|jgi:hypothetical protein|nr:YciI family protein [Chthoniobacteraceae bacterium]